MTGVDGDGCSEMHRGSCAGRAGTFVVVSSALTALDQEQLVCFHCDDARATRQIGGAGNRGDRDGRPARGRPWMNAARPAVRKELMDAWG